MAVCPMPWKTKAPNPPPFRGFVGYVRSPKGDMPPYKEKVLSEQDLAGYRSEIEAPLRYSFKGTDVLSCGPWCQGPVLLQMLSLLNEVDLAALGHNSKDYVHLLAEVMNLCFADREPIHLPSPPC